jgi:hypothetical protein
VDSGVEMMGPYKNHAEKSHEVACIKMITSELASTDFNIEFIG